MMTVSMSQPLTLDEQCCCSNCRLPLFPPPTNASAEIMYFFLLCARHSRRPGELPSDTVRTPLLRRSFLRKEAARTLQEILFLSPLPVQSMLGSALGVRSKHVVSELFDQNGVELESILS